MLIIEKLTIIFIFEEEPCPNLIKLLVPTGFT
jgi:hypothetical protein